MGYRTDCTSQVFFQSNIDSLGSYDRYVFHRPIMTPNIVDFLSDNYKSNKIIADFDDLNFRVEYAADTPAVQCRGEEVVKVRKSLSQIAGAAGCFDQFSSSTVPLSDHVKIKFSPNNSQVIYNAVDPGFAGICSQVYEALKGKKRQYKFAYFPGTASHNPDLAMIENALAQALQDDSKAKLLLAGPIAIPKRLQPYSAQIRKVDYVSFHELPKLMATAEAVLAPLVDNAFSDCKSGLKFFEAALVGCRVIASPIPDIDKFESPLLIKCRSEMQWYEAFSMSGLGMSQSVLNDAVNAVKEQTCISIQAKSWVNGFLN